MITRDDVARLAGVSPATVSYVVNDGPRPVAAATRQRVLRAIEQLDYHPSAVARSLKTRRSGTIGLIIPDILNPIHATVAKAIEDGLLAAHCNVVLCNSDEDPARELAYLRMLRSKQVDGMILFPTAGNHALLLKLCESGKPIVLMDRQVPGLAADRVLLDNEAGAYAAMQHLIACRHARCAFINLPTSETPGQGRLAGYLRALHEAGLSADPSLMAEGSFKGQESRAVAHALLTAIPRPTAVFATSNRLAHGVLAVIKRLHLRMPDEIALAVFDDLEYYTVATPSITAVSYDLDRYAREAVRLLLERIDGTYTAEPRLVTIPHRLVIRESTASVPTPCSSYQHN